MAKTHKITHDGKEYTLVFSVRTVSEAEQDGLDIMSAEKAPITTIYKLFKGAFQKNYRGVFTDDELWDIFEEQEDLSELSKVLMEMYTEAARALTGEKKREKKKQ